MRVLDLFAGIGGFSLGLERTGHFETAAFCEFDQKAREVLRKNWPHIPIYNDVRELTGEQLKKDGISIDVITGGFPCQDLSIANTGAYAGLAGERSGLWFEYLRLIKEIAPKWVIIENVSALRSRGLDEVLRGLVEVGYDAEWHCIPASAVGASHRRDRIWIIAYPRSKGWEGPIADHSILVTAVTPFAIPRHQSPDIWCRMAERTAPVRDGNGLPVHVERERLKQLGNAVVPQIPELIGRAIYAASTT